MMQNGKTNGKTKQKPPLTATEILDRLPPCDLQAEVGLLGSVVLMPEVLDDVTQTLASEDFYDDAHRKLYEHMQALHEAGRRFDVTLLIDRLKAMGDFDKVGGTAYLSTIINSVPNAAHAVYYAEIVRGHSTARKLILASAETMLRAYEPGVNQDELVASAEAAIARVSDSTIRGNEIQPVTQVVPLALAALEERMCHRRSRLLNVGLSALHSCMGLVAGGVTLLAGRPSQGKCLSRGTPVLMHDGTVRPIETIRTGDRVMGPDSLPRTVISITSGRDEMFVVKQSHSMTYRVNKQHIICLKRIKTDKLQRRGKLLEISIAEAIQKPKGWWSRWHGYKVGVEYPSATQPVDPYFLGYWLGDGNSASSRVTTADHEIVEFLQEYANRRGQKLHVSPKRDNKALDYTIGDGRADRHTKYWSIKCMLDRLNVIGNKHIPRSYLIASREQRLQLLAGLVDSDGHYSTGNNGFDITMANRLLIGDIKTLADGLGFRTKLRYKKSSCKSGAYEFSGDSWRLMISGDIGTIPTKVERKRPAYEFGGGCNRDALTNKIEIMPDGEDEYFGFTLDGDGLFLLEDGTVTHNSAALVSILRYVARHSQVAYVATLEMTAMELTDRILAAEANVSYYRMLSGTISQDDRARIVDRSCNVAAWSIDFDDRPGMTLAQIAASARRQKRRHGRLDLLAIDYLQLVTPDDERSNRVEQLDKIARSCKRMARELQVPVLGLVQVNRQANDNAESIPRLQNLKGSGGFEEHSDSVVFVHRPDWYNRKHPDAGQPETAQMIVEKNRNGPTAIHEVLFWPEWMDFTNKASPQQEADARNF